MCECVSVLVCVFVSVYVCMSMCLCVCAYVCVYVGVSGGVMIINAEHSSTERVQVLVALCETNFNNERRKKKMNGR